jgi:hypothetical protein
MGHLVNPISHRLGASKCWNSVWAVDKNFLLGFSLLMKSDWDFFLFFKRFFDLKIITQSGYIFSHVKIVRSRQKVFCVVYFYDGGALERSDHLRQILLSKSSQLFGIELMFFISLYSFMRLYQWNVYSVRFLRNFKFNLLFDYFHRKLLKIKLHSFLRNSFFLAFWSLVISFLEFCVVLEPDFFFEIYYLFSKQQSHGVKQVTFVFIHYMFTSIGNAMVTLPTVVLKNFFVNFYFLFKRFKNSLILMRSLFFDLIKVSFLIVRWFIFKRMRIVSKMVRSGFQLFSFNRFVMYYFSDAFLNLFRLKSRLLFSIKSLVAKLPYERNLSKIKIVLKKLDVSDLNAAVLSKYLAIRLRQRFQLKEALMPMLRHLSNNKYVRGFRIVCAGRFTRKEIALYDLRTYSSVPFSGVTSRLDFSLSEVILKYSICGIKVWLHKNVLSERDFIIDAIGLQFVPIPPVTEDFLDLLCLTEETRAIPYRPDVFDLQIFRYFVDTGLDYQTSRKNFINFSSRLGLAFDFFFYYVSDKVKSLPSNLEDLRNIV